MKACFSLLMSHETEKAHFMSCTWHKRVPFSDFFQSFSSLGIFCFTLESKGLISDVGLHPLHAHAIK